jgi:hypothetical protein
VQPQLAQPPPGARQASLDALECAEAHAAHPVDEGVVAQPQQPPVGHHQAHGERVPGGRVGDHQHGLVGLERVQQLGAQGVTLGVGQPEARRRPAPRDGRRDAAPAPPAAAQLGVGGVELAHPLAAGRGPVRVKALRGLAVGAGDLLVGGLARHAEDQVRFHVGIVP